MSLRERQRQQVRAEIQRAAFALFARSGFDQVTTEQIAAAAEVSPSTYFRHVRSKEDLLLDPVREGGEGIAVMLEGRPEDEPADVALARAILARSTALGIEELEHWRTAFATAPHLLDRVALIPPDHRARLVELAAQRMGTDPATDSRPALMVHLMLAAAEFGYLQWLRSTDNPAASLPVCVEAAVAVVLGDRWGSATDPRSESDRKK